MSIINGFRAELIDRVLGNAGHIEIATGQYSSSEVDQLINRLEQRDDVVTAMPIVQSAALAVSASTSSGAFIRGMRTDDAMKLPYLQATHIAVRVGQFVGAGFITLTVLGIWGNIMVALIGVLVLIIAQTELMRVRAEEALKNGPDLSRLFGGIFGGNSRAGAGPGTWNFTVGGQPPPGSQGAETQGDDPPPPRGDSDCVIDVDSDGKVRKIWRKDDAED